VAEVSAPPAVASWWQAAGLAQAATTPADERRRPGERSEERAGKTNFFAGTTGVIGSQVSTRELSVEELQDA